MPRQTQTTDNNGFDVIAGPVMSEYPSIERTIVPLRTISEVKPNSFIFERPGALAADFCDEVVRRFEASPHYQREGVIGQLGSQDSSIKRTMDLVVSDKDDWQDIDEIFFRTTAAAMNEFCKSFPYFSKGFKDMGYQVQRYEAGDYYHWHIDGGSHQFAARQLVLLWYLNDVPGPGGETEFLYQDISVRPEKGKLVMFPPFWTHEHRAARVQQGRKYIATTWVVFA
ncbi:MAG: 2OG-Fe(II) oxygenase [Chromatiales bacterium]